MLRQYQRPHQATDALLHLVLRDVLQEWHSGTLEIGGAETVVAEMPGILARTTYGYGEACGEGLDGYERQSPAIVETMKGDAKK